MDAISLGLGNLRPFMGHGRQQLAKQSTRSFFSWGNSRRSTYAVWPLGRQRLPGNIFFPVGTPDGGSVKYTKYPQYLRKVSKVRDALRKQAAILFQCFHLPGDQPPLQRERGERGSKSSLLQTTYYELKHVRSFLLNAIHSHQMPSEPLKLNWDKTHIKIVEQWSNHCGTSSRIRPTFVAPKTLGDT